MSWTPQAGAILGGGFFFVLGVTSRISGVSGGGSGGGL